MDLILASNSPRRHELLKQLGYTFRIEAPHASEDLDGLQALEAPGILAERKALDVSQRMPQSAVLGYDTLVFLDSRPMGKPDSSADARRMLESLRGRTHQVITGIALCHNGISLYRSQEITQVHFREFTDQELLDYIATQEPMDKAGAYGIQGRGARLVRSVEGCFYNVVGLPVAQTIEALNRFRSSHV